MRVALLAAIFSVAVYAQEPEEVIQRAQRATDNTQQLIEGVSKALAQLKQALTAVESDIKREKAQQALVAAKRAVEMAKAGHHDAISQFINLSVAIRDAEKLLGAGPAPPANKPVKIGLVNLGPIICEGPGDKVPCNKVTDFSGMVYDKARHQMLMFGGGHASVFTDAVYRLNLDSHSWSEVYRPTPCKGILEKEHDASKGAFLQGEIGPYPRPTSRHTYDMLNIINDELIILAGEQSTAGSCAQGLINKITEVSVSHYDINQDAWSFADQKTVRFFPGTAVDPLTGTILTVSQREIGLYNPVTKNWRLIESKNRPFGIENSLVYVPLLGFDGEEIGDAFYLFYGKERALVAKIKPVRTENNVIISVVVDLVETSGTASGNRRGYAYDDANQIIGGGIDKNRFYAFDPRSDEWNSRWLTNGLADQTAFHALAYDAKNNQFVFVDNNSTTWTYRYDPAPQLAIDWSGTISVGPNELITKPSYAAPYVQDGATIEIAGGEYINDPTTWRANNITLRGVEGRPHLRMIEQIGTAHKSDQQNGKAIWVIAGDNITIDNIEFSGAKVRDRNGAGIRAEGENITVLNSYFHHNENGILGGNGVVRIEQSEFSYNGTGDGKTHNVYINDADELIFKENYSHHAITGHNLKTRAKINHIYRNRLEDGKTGNSSYIIDIPQGGLSYIAGNQIQQGADTENFIIVSYGAETNKPRHSFQVLRAHINTLINDRHGGRFFYLSDDTKYLIEHNSFIGPGDHITGGAPMIEAE